MPDILQSPIQEILRTLGKAAEVYTRKNLRMLYDAISTLADAVGSALGKPSLLALFMPPLLVKWQQFADSDRELMPLMEVFTALATALGESPLLSLCSSSSRSAAHGGWGGVHGVAATSIHFSLG